MTPAEIAPLPPIPRLIDYPAASGVALIVTATAILLVIVKYFDATGGALTISLLVVLAFLALLAFVVFFTIPTDEITSATVGGLVASFGAIIAYWLGRKN